MHVPLGVADLRHALFGVGRFADQRRMERARQHLLDALAHDGMIVDEKDSCHVLPHASPEPVRSRLFRGPARRRS